MAEGYQLVFLFQKQKSSGESDDEEEEKKVSFSETVFVKNLLKLSYGWLLLQSSSDDDLNEVNKVLKQTPNFISIEDLR